MDKNNKKIIIYNKFYQLDKKIDPTYFHNNGNAMNSDRTCTIIDSILMCHLSLKNRFISILANYFFYNNDFKKQKFLSTNKINKFRIFNNLLLWSSIIGLIICLIFGIAIPIFNAAADSISLVQGNYTGSVIANNKVIGWVVVQDNLINFSNTLLNKLSNININTNYNDFFNSNSDLLWLKFYIDKYFGPTNKLEGIEALIQFKNFLSTHVFTDFKFIDFNEDFQVLIYFKMVSQTILLDLQDQTLITQIINSWNGSSFAKLPKDNIFYGLTINSICLTDNKSSQALLVPKIWSVWFNDPSVIIPLIFTLFFILIVVFNYYVIRKNKIKYRSMGLYDYLSSKSNFIKKMNLFLNKLIFLNNNVDNLKHNLILDFDSLTKNDTYNILRLTNFLYSTIESMSLVFVLNYSDELKKELDKICLEDTQNLKIDVIDDKLLNSWINNKSNKNIHYIDQNTEQYKNYLRNYLNNLNQIKSQNIFKNILKSISKKFEIVKLSNEDKNKIVDEILNENIINTFNNESFDSIKFMLKTRNWQLVQIMNEIISKTNGKNK